MMPDLRTAEIGAELEAEREGIKAAREAQTQLRADALNEAGQDRRTASAFALALRWDLPLDEALLVLGCMAPALSPEAILAVLVRVPTVQDGASACVN